MGWRPWLLTLNPSADGFPVAFFSLLFPVTCSLSTALRAPGTRHLFFRPALVVALHPEKAHGAVAARC
jgi:hypothetical protein